MAGEPFTVDHFREWCRGLRLDSGDWWEIEDFQAEVAADVFAGAPEIWMVVPEGNGKTTLMAGIALYHGEHQQFPFVPIGASSREQAEVLYRQAEGFVQRSPSLAGKFKCQEGYRRIKCLEQAGRIQVYAADDRTGDGVIPTLALLDELHRHKDLRLYRTWRGKLDKRGGQILTISTAGEPGSDFEETRARILKTATDVESAGAHIRAATHAEDGSPLLVLHDWAVRDREQSEDMRVVEEANPRREITAEKLVRKRRSETMTDEHWQRFVCNIATRISGQAITPEEWEMLAEPGLELEEEAQVLGWLDLGWKVDTTAMGVVVWESKERRVVTGVKVIEPPVEEDEIVLGLLELQRTFDPEAVVYDPNAGGQQMAQLLEKGEHPLQVDAPQISFVEHTQDNAPMADAAVKLDEAIRNGWLVHDGDQTLKLHALNAVKKSLGGEKWKYDRPPEAKGERRRKFPIDALTGLVFGHHEAVARFGADPVPPPLIEVFG